jgi:hypothetical protein
MARDPAHRTSARTLRKLAAGHVFYEFGDGERGIWDRFSTRNIGLAVQRHMATTFDGDAEKMRRATTAALAQSLRVELDSWAPVEQRAFANFAFVLSLVPELARWTSAQKQALVEIIRAKAAPEETAYLRLLQQHPALKEAFVRLGSRSPAADAAARSE